MIFPYGNSAIELIKGRFSILEASELTRSFLIGVSVVIDVNDPVRYFDVNDEEVYEWGGEPKFSDTPLRGLIRFTYVSAMSSAPGRALLVGPPGRIEMLAACVIREHSRCSPAEAIRRLRRIRPKSFRRLSEIKFVQQYKPKNWSELEDRA